MPTICGTVAIGSWPNHSIGEDTAAEVKFGIEFYVLPVVSVQLSAIDAASPNSKRIELWTSDENCSGFRIHARTWDDAITYSLKASWVATSEFALVQLGTLTLPKRGSDASPDVLTDFKFPRSFGCSPDVVFGLSSISIPGCSPICAWPEKVDTHAGGFGLKCTGADPSSVVDSASMSWVATASPAVLQAGCVDVGSPGGPIKDGVDNFLDVSFDRAFHGIPSVVVAICGVESDARAHTRIDTWTDQVTQNGFRLHTRSWEDSIIIRARITWMATPIASKATSSNIPPHQPPANFVVDGPPLGQGWCAVTHRARHVIDGNVYAVKTSRYPFKLHEQALRQELQNLTRLPLHFNLLRYHESIMQGGRLHIVMEYLDAFSIAQLVPPPDGTILAARKKSVVLRWISQILDGLAHLHGVGLVHRDLHGENILVEKAADGCPSQGPRAIRIIDFGAAGSYSEPLAPRLMSHEAGCPQYFSPERRRGEAFDDSDDVWATGCHLVELASGIVIRKREGCGDEGSDFATAARVVQQAVRDCDNGGCEGGRWCRELAEAILVDRIDLRPRAARARELTQKALSYAERKRPPQGALGYTFSSPCVVGRRKIGLRRC